MNEPLLHFVETPIFTKRIDKLASVEVLFDLQNELIINPKRGDVLQGTNGARKARIGERQQKRGKSGSFRYIYIYLEQVGIVYLMFIFAKNEQVNLIPLLPFLKRLLCVIVHYGNGCAASVEGGCER